MNFHVEDHLAKNLAMIIFVLHKYEHIDKDVICSLKLIVHVNCNMQINLNIINYGFIDIKIDSDIFLKFSLLISKEGTFVLGLFCTFLLNIV